MAEKDKKSSDHPIELSQSSNQSATSNESLRDTVLNASPMSQHHVHKNVQFRRKRSSLSESQVIDVDAQLLKNNGGGKLEKKIPRPIYRKSKSLYGTKPETHFGPKACLLESKDSTLIIQDPSSQMLRWYQPPQSVMIVTKSTRDDCTDDPLFELATWLSEVKKLKVYVENSVLDNPLIADQLAYKRIRSSLSTFTEGLDDLSGKIDLIICLGGDGALVYVSTLFQGSVPPVMAFHLGSLGFLSPFEFSDYKERISQVLDGNEVPLILRTRLKCDLMDGSRETISPVKSSIRDVESRRHIMALNEVVVDRGATPYLCQLDLYIEDTLVTVVQGDGLIISTPTGSTGYAAAAGASMVHPSVPAIVIAPICPHSLSFRPIIVPAGVDIKIAVSPNARDAAWVSFDGRNRRTLQKRDVLVIGTSMYPLPSVCRSDPIADWFESLAGCLHWNVRKSQSALAPPDTGRKNLDVHDSDISVGGVATSIDTDTEDGNKFISDLESNNSR